MTDLLRMFRPTPKYLRDGCCTTADQLRAYWEIAPDDIARRDAGLVFLTIVAAHVVPSLTKVGIPEARYPSILQFVNGEIAQVVDDIKRFVGADTDLFDEAFAQNLSYGFQNHQYGMRNLGNEVVIERAAAIDVYFGKHVLSHRMEDAVRFILLSMEKITNIYIHREDIPCWLRDLELLKLFASKRPAGQLTAAELWWLDSRVRYVMGRRLTCTSLEENNRKRGSQLVERIRRELSIA